jgi:hypothetical protein
MARWSRNAVREQDRNAVTVVLFSLVFHKYVSAPKS